MSAPTKWRLAWQTVLATYSGICWLVAGVSWLATFDWFWRLLGATQCRLSEVGLAGQGHCWLCGMSRGFRAIWHGRFAEALTYNPHSVALFAIMLVGCVYGASLLFPKMFRRLRMPQMPNPKAQIRYEEEWKMYSRQ